VVAVEFPAAALLVRKAFIQGMNYIDQRYGHSWADAEICFQARRGGKKILLVPQATGVWHAIPDPGGDLAEADRVAGAATFYGKHFGYVVALRFRLAAILRAFMGLRLGLVSNLLSGQKIDGTQGND
jgi:GT2 family glycosyltransferase